MKKLSDYLGDWLKGTPTVTLTYVQIRKAMKMAMDLEERAGDE